MKEDKKYTVKKVEFKAIKDDWSWFEVLLYNEKDDKILAYTFSPVMFNSIDNRINKYITNIYPVRVRISSDLDYSHLIFRFLLQNNNFRFFP